MDKQIFWQNHVRQYEQSGITAKAYCQNNGLGYSTFYKWKRQLKAGFDLNIELDCQLIERDSVRRK